MDFVIKIFRILFFMLDEVIYGLIDDFYALLLQLCRTSIFTQDVISEFAKRVYALVGIFMLFKVTLSIITYILNPDDFSDKEKGFTSIVKHVILSLVLVVITPYIFSEAYDLQTIILEDNTIMNVVFGTPAEAHMPNTSYVESAGNKIQFTIMYAFAQPNIDDFYTDSNTNLASCATTYKKDSNGNYEFRALPKYDIEVASACEAGKSCFIYELNPDCFGTYNADNDTYENGPLYNAFNEYESEESIAGATVYQNYAQGIAQQNFNMFFRKDIMLATVDTDGTKRYIIDYKFGISTAVGVGVLYLLLLFCIDIAVRSVKLGFLQMIAPIPIISYCDPKSKKDGMFSKWLKMCTSTYLELFFRLFALYFGIYVISLIGTFKDVITNQKVDGFFVSVFMIIGILIFVKQLPKILEDGLGIKGASKFHFNPIKKLEEEALFGKNITGGAAGLLMGRSPAAALRGFTQGKGWNDTLKNQRDMNEKLRQARLNGSTLGGRMGARVSNALGTGGELGRIQQDKQDLSDRIKDIDDSIKNQEGRIKQIKGTPEYRDRSRRKANAQAVADSAGKLKERAIDQVKNGQGAAGAEYQRRMREAEALRHVKAGETYNGVTYATEADAARAAMQMEQSAENYLQNAGWREYSEEAHADTTLDATFNSLSSKFEDAYRYNTGHDYTDNWGDDLNRTLGGAKGDVTRLEVEMATAEREIADIQRVIDDYNSQKEPLREQMEDLNERETRAKANRDAIR